MIFNHQALPEFARCLYSEADVLNAIRAQAKVIGDSYTEGECVVWCILNGGLVYTGHLVTMLPMALQVDYVHATRYRDNEAGTRLNWLASPKVDVTGKHVLICDDIFDEGITLQAVCDYARSLGAKSVKTAVMVKKQHDRVATSHEPDFVAQEVEDSYVFGMGMDYNNYWRNAPGIWAVKS